MEGHAHSPAGDAAAPAIPDDVGVRPVRLADAGDCLHLLDQRALPGEERWLELREVEAVAEAIESLAVRGAPAIACAAALGLAAASTGFPRDPGGFRGAAEAALARLAATRPTAVNLFVAIAQLRAALAAAPETADVVTLQALVRRTAQAHVDDDLRRCLAMARHGAALLPEGGTILTHCNTGALATAGWGTALGVIRQAHRDGRGIRVLVDETRPVLQGARLTAWELRREGVPAEVITDSMAAALMGAGEVQAAIVGADRIARNGDVANKIGTYGVAVACHHHRIPFYVAAPWTTIDLGLASGRDIPIEQRSGDEVRRHGGVLMTAADQPVRNPAFDVTPAALVTAIITERGVHAPTALARS
jgi:methylthioribose-1-phosphate isomerase